MTHQKSTKQEKRSGTDRAHRKQLRWLLVLAIVAPMFWLGLTLFANYRQTEISSAARSAQATPTPKLSEQALKDTAWDPAWMPLPNAGTPAQPIEQVRAMYAFTARHPEVMEYAPCYCGCESGGHRSARDCFVKGRTADDKPQWDGMGFI